MADSVPGKKGRCMADSVHLGSESIDEDSIERIKAEEEELLKKLQDTDSERKTIEASLKLRRERLVNKLKYDVEDLQKSLAEMKLDNDRLKKELAEQKDVVRFSYKEKQQLVEELEGSCQALKKKNRESEEKFNDHFHQLVQENTTLKQSNSQLEATMNDMKAENHQIRSYANMMESTASKLDQKLRKSREEVEGLKQHIAQVIDDNERQKQKLNAEIQRVNSENKQLKSRVSKLAGAQLMDNNPDIADLNVHIFNRESEEKFNDHYHQLEEENTKLKQSNGKLEATINEIKAEDHHIRSYANEMASTASKLDQKLRKSREEVEGLKQHIAQVIDDYERQKQKLNAEIQRVNSENKQLKSSPSADSKAQVHKAVTVAKDTDKAAEMSQPSKSQQRQQAAMSKTVIQTGRQPSNPVQQTNMSATLPPTSATK